MNPFITGSEARRLIVEQQAQVVDVRNPAEFSNGSAPGAINIPVQLIPQLAPKQLDSSRPVVVFCVSGARSAQAQMILNSIGFSQVHNACNAQNLING